MPYRIVNGTDIQHKVGGKWVLKQHCSSPANAKKAMRLLYAIEDNPDFVENKTNGKKLNKPKRGTKGEK
jgi:hypothetical protein